MQFKIFSDSTIALVDNICENVYIIIDTYILYHGHFQLILVQNGAKKDHI